MARKKRFEDADGNYLVVTRDNRLAWYCPDVDDVGAIVGEDYCADDDPMMDWEERAVRMVTRSLAEDTDNGFVFPTTAVAKKALSLANEALWREADGIAWPEWAMKALSEGWTAPKCWMPRHEGKV